MLVPRGLGATHRDYRVQRWASSSFERREGPGTKTYRVIPIGLREARSEGSGGMHVAYPWPDLVLLFDSRKTV